MTALAWASFLCSLTPATPRCLTPSRLLHATNFFFSSTHHLQSSFSSCSYIPLPFTSSLCPFLHHSYQPLISSSLFSVVALLVSSSRHFLCHLSPPPPPTHLVLSVCSAGGSTGRGLGVAGESASSSHSQPEPVYAGAQTIPASGGAQQRAAKET